MKFLSSLTKISLISGILLTAQYSKPQERPVQVEQGVAATLSQDAKLFMVAFALGPAMLLNEYVEKTPIIGTYIGVIQGIPWFGKFIRFYPLYLALNQAMVLSGTALGDSKKSFAIALMGLMLGWSIAESILVNNGRGALESFAVVLIENMQNLVWRVTGKLELPSKEPFILKI